KRPPPPDPEDPPRRRAPKKRGPGTGENDRPPLAGLAGRESGRVDLAVLAHAGRADRERVGEDTPTPGGAVSTDAWSGAAPLGELDRSPAAVCHTPGKRPGARDDDGAGGNEVPNNTCAGRRVGRRTFLRVVRGVSQHSLGQATAI